MSGRPLIKLEKVSRSYATPRGEVTALFPTDLEIEAGQFVVFLGPSGSGKTTLLNLLAGMDRPSAGRLWVDDIDLGALDEDARREYRRQKVGLVFQFFNLLPNLTALENVELVAELAGGPGRALDWLEKVGLADRADHFPHELSGGEQQRVAIARTLIKSPVLVLADEPTGNLDLGTSQTVLKLFQEVHRAGSSIGLVTHNPVLAQAATRVVTMASGRIVTDVRNPSPVAVENLCW